MRRAGWWLVFGVACGAPEEPVAPEVPELPSLEAQGARHARVLRERIAREVDCETSHLAVLCKLRTLGEGARPSWPSDARKLLPGLVFGVRPSRTLERGLLATANLAVAVVGEGGVAVVGVQAEDPDARSALVDLRRTFMAQLFPREGGASADLMSVALPDVLVESLSSEAIPLDPVDPGESSWVGQSGVWYALPSESAPARWVRIEPHGEGARFTVFLEPES